MSRRGWIGVTLGLVVLVAAYGSWMWMQQRGPAKAGAPAQPPAAAVASKPPLEIPADEILTVQRGPLAQAISVTGSVRAVNSAVVKSPRGWRTQPPHRARRRAGVRRASAG